MSKPRVTVLLSGSGRSLENLLRWIERGDLVCDIVGVIASRGKIRGIEIAEQAGIPCQIIRRRDFDSVAAFSEANTQAIEEHQSDLVVMAGYLSFYQLPNSLVGKVLNIHPSLLPLFGGKGFYGHHVHKAALEAGVRVSGCTVHFVNNEYDNGPYVLQMPVPIHPGDDTDALASRVFETECEALPTAIRWVLEGHVRYDDGKCVFSPEAKLP